MSHDITHHHSPKFTIMTIRKEIGRFPHSWYSNVRVALWLQRSYTSLTLPVAMVCYPTFGQDSGTRTHVNCITL